MISHSVQQFIQGFNLGLNQQNILNLEIYPQSFRPSHP
jgi:hypothetical protein